MICDLKAIVESILNHIFLLRKFFLCTIVGLKRKDAQESKKRKNFLLHLETQLHYKQKYYSIFDHVF